MVYTNKRCLTASGGVGYGPRIVASQVQVLAPSDTNTQTQTWKPRNLAIDAPACLPSLPATATATASLTTPPPLSLALALFAPHYLLIPFALAPLESSFLLLSPLAFILPLHIII
jgi:hypothetical protein